MSDSEKEWRQLRCAWLGASSIVDIMAKGKNGAPSASRANVMARLITERLSGKPTETFQSKDMSRGLELEDEAANAYAFMNNAELTKPSFIRHPTIEFAGATPDRFVGDEGLLEMKCFNMANHIETLLTEKIERAYLLQMQWQMAVTRRPWCDFMAYSPDFPPSMRIFQKRIPRDERTIAEITVEVREFIGELNDKTILLEKKFNIKRAV
jgi:putative phage-type endonuclease